MATASDTLMTIQDFAKEIGWSRQALGELVRTLGLKTYPMAGAITAKGLDSEARARIRQALCLDQSDDAA
jgi:DNA-binding MurR/RpiR family transcriptional regulator